jgi:hypothetical protein
MFCSLRVLNDCHFTFNPLLQGDTVDVHSPTITFDWCISRAGSIEDDSIIRKTCRKMQISESVMTGFYLGRRLVLQSDMHF